LGPIHQEVLRKADRYVSSDATEDDIIFFGIEDFMDYTKDEIDMVMAEKSEQIFL
jgi:hypothetical protein